MIVVWVILLVLQRGHSLVPVITVDLGEPASVTCVLPEGFTGSEEIYWYKQRAADNLELIVTLWNSRPEYSPEFSPPRLEVIGSKTLSKLTVLKTTEEDEGIYHCAVRAGINSQWNGTYLLVKGNTERTSNYSVAQRSTVSDPVHPGDSVSLQCSVLSDSDTKTCPGGHSVYWFRTKSDKSHPHVLYTNVNDKCEQRSDSVKSCVYRFSKTVSSSDAGTYHCAVATCGRILFGDGSNLVIEDTNLSPMSKVIICLLSGGLAISLGVIAILICHMTSYGNDAVTDKKKSEQTKDEPWFNSAAVFTIVKTSSGKKKDLL